LFLKIEILSCAIEQKGCCGAGTGSSRSPSILFAVGHHALQFIVEPLCLWRFASSRFPKEVRLLQFCSLTVFRSSYINIFWMPVPFYFSQLCRDTQCWNVR
jgi:hypothetical protein